MPRLFNEVRREFREKRREEPLVLAVYVVLRALVLLTLVRCIFTGRYEYVLLCALILVLMLLPTAVERAFRIELPDVLETIILIFIFAAEILGEVESFYVRIPMWDTILHTTWGFLCAGIGFSLFDVLNRSESSKVQLTPIYLAVCAVAFSMAVGACWEIFEYFMDTVVGLDMQKDTLVTGFGTVWLDPSSSNVVIPVRDIVSTRITLASGEVVNIAGGYLDIGINDTMADLIVNLIGAVVFAIIGFAYMRQRDKHQFISRLIPRALRQAGE